MTHSRRSRPRQALAAIGLGLALLATGCGDDAPEPSRLGGTEDKLATSATATPAFTSTPTSTPTATAAPAADREEELHAATVHFYDTIAHAYRTLDTSPVEDLLTPGSNAASGYTDYIEQVKSRNHSFGDVSAYTITAFEHLRDGNTTTEEVRFHISTEGLTEVDAQGDLVAEVPPATADARIKFVKEGDRWLVSSQRLNS